MKIKALVMDVDGTLTDGGLYIGSQGEIMKRFHVKDGYGIHNMLPQMGIIPIILTGRNSEIVLERCRELDINKVIQGSTDKVKDMKALLEAEDISLNEVAYIGDDLNDLECMKLVKVRGCPKDAANEVKEICEYVSAYTGGNGAVRDFIEWIRFELEMKSE